MSQDIECPLYNVHKNLTPTLCDITNLHARTKKIWRVHTKKKKFDPHTMWLHKRNSDTHALWLCNGNIYSHISWLYNRIFTPTLCVITKEIVTPTLCDFTTEILTLILCDFTSKYRITNFSFLKRNDENENDFGHPQLVTFTNKLWVWGGYD